jgi:hypothetical protein
LCLRDVIVKEVAASAKRNVHMCDYGSLYVVMGNMITINYFRHDT